MIVSCHVPKTAGTTFEKLLRKEFGRGLYVDYGDRVGWTGPDAELFRSRRGIPRKVARAHRRGRLRAVHGHFYASKYANVYPEADLTAFIREPVARVISNYRYLASHPEIDHPLVAEFHEAEPELEEWIEWPWARNMQSLVLDVPVERFAFIGITEQLERSMCIFDRIFETSLADRYVSQRLNVSTKPVTLDEDVPARVAALNEADVALYEEVMHRFEQQAASVGE